METGRTLEIEPGVKIKWNGGGLNLWGPDSKIVALGTPENPIIFTSAKENPSRGDWSGILFYSDAIEGNILDHCQILYAGNLSSNTKMASIHICCNDSAVTISNCTIAHSSHWGICITGDAEPVLSNNSYFDNYEGDVLYYGK